MNHPLDEAIGRLTSVCGLLTAAPVSQSFDDAIPLLEDARARLQAILNSGAPEADSPLARLGLDEPEKLRELDLAVARVTALAGSAASFIAGWDLLRKDIPKPAPSVSIQA
ncbi:MAG: hypothetical protein FJW40_19765 [Acidobacteria bacterium]|nr:hypothetical protein [Acidobacteriota bacterium]